MKPNLRAVDGAGWCLRFVQTVFNAPVMHESAWQAWRATTRKHTGPLPNAPVPVWFSHYGTYGSPPRYDNFGHVVAWIPGQGFLSSPRAGHGREWFSTIADVERAFNARYVGWSEDLNTKTIYTPPTRAKELTMSEVDEIKKYVKKELDAMERRLKGSSQLGWIKNKLQRLWMRDPVVSIDVDAKELAAEIREAFGDDLAADVAAELTITTKGDTQ